jgi:hypothetical protein
MTQSKIDLVSRGPSFKYLGSNKHMSTVTMRSDPLAALNVKQHSAIAHEVRGRGTTRSASIDGTARTCIRDVLGRRQRRRHSRHTRPNSTAPPP